MKLYILFRLRSKNIYLLDKYINNLAYYFAIDNIYQLDLEFFLLYEPKIL